ncbi:hypothetical protein [Archaeoglobus neptunius]|uniref:hypothetical protein n=1 Tax=Archaeoglobus neptunius TaxID=2798580 RepID=UPI001925A87A|nr:hypothetical protein [Archaeoglobus neptunius]
MADLSGDSKGQMILLFAFVTVVVILTLSYIYAQNVIAGIESSRALMVFPKEEIRNLVEIQQKYGTSINPDIQKLCAINGWVCYIGIDKVEFKNVEVDYCGGPGC